MKYVDGFVLVVPKKNLKAYARMASLGGKIWKEHGALEEDMSERVKAMSAATDNVGLFYGEDIFIAISSILLIQGALKAYGIELTPFELSVWAIPSAVCAFLIHAARLLLLDRQLRRSSR